MLDVEGAHQRAVDILLETYEKHPHDISLLLEVMNIQCNSKVNISVEFEDLIKGVGAAQYTDGISPIMHKLSDSVVLSNCTLVSKAQFHQLLLRLVNIKNIKFHKDYLADMYFLNSDIYMLERNLDKAMGALEKAFHYKKKIIIPLRQAELLSSAGLYEEAHKFISVAKKLDDNRSITKPSQMNEIIKTEKIILDIYKR